MASSNSSAISLGGFQPIPDVKNKKQVQELGKFAVAEYKKEHPKEAAALVFVEVVEAQSQVVAGTNYRLLIKTLKAGYVNHYKAVVYEKPWENVKTLTSFEPAIFCVEPLCVHSVHNGLSRCMFLCSSKFCF